MYVRHQATSVLNKRLHALRKEKNYYNKFIFNGHFMVFLLILLGAFIFGYGEWLKRTSNEYQFCINSSSDCCVDIHFSNATTPKRSG
ncbi:ABC transporter permease [Staphylococcus aureus]